MRPREDRRSRARRAATLVFCLCGLVPAAGTGDRADAPADRLLRGEGAVRPEATLWRDGGAGAQGGGVSDGDDWLG